MNHTSRRRFLQSTFAAGIAAGVCGGALRQNTLADDFHSHDSLIASSTRLPTHINASTDATKPLLEPRPGETLLTILHTNDTHSQIDPLPAGDKYAGRGGVARRATLVKQARAAQPNTLLVDAGDACQGTPYFNLYKGEVEFKAMSALGYDAMTLGNHEFDNGVDALANALQYTNFPVVNANYQIKGTKLEPIVKPYVVKEVAGLRVGIFGLGVTLEGLNAPATFRGVVYQDPVETARQTVKRLQLAEGCHFVLCLSHLGYYPDSTTQLGDTQLAAQVDGIDFIVSGHSHTFMDAPVAVRQPSGKETVVFQVGKSGIFLGRVDFLVSRNSVAAVKGCVLDTLI